MDKSNHFFTSGKLILHVALTSIAYTIEKFYLLFDFVLLVGYNIHISTQSCSASSFHVSLYNVSFSQLCMQERVKKQLKE